MKIKLMTTIVALVAGEIFPVAGTVADNEIANYMENDIISLTATGWETVGKDIEPGMEYGVSAPFAGRIGEYVIMAGGCNFPRPDPLAATAVKQFYRGVYAADTVNLVWKRIGSLPEGIAYGVTAQVPKGLVLIGGTTALGSQNSVKLLSINERGEAEFSALPSLPVTVDNAACAAIGSKVYIAGGNVDGKPSNGLLMLDLESEMPTWISLASIPGNCRTQPVMATGVNSHGETCLYLFGGFAGRYEEHEPTLNVDGAVYNPSVDAWEMVAGPLDADGREVSLGGGCAATLSHGRIVFAGGVNRDVFLSALIDQAPDYLQHPISWYRFNPNIFVLDPRTMTWECSGNHPETARAGAGMVAGCNNDAYLLGGELKPRIRTADTARIMLK